MDVFATAAANAGTGSKPKTKIDGNVVTPEDPEVRDAIDDFVEAKREESEAKSRKEAAKGVVTIFSKDVYFTRFAEGGSKPEKSLTFKGNKESVKLVVQDKGEDERYFISDEQLDILRMLLGDETLEEVLMEYTKYSFDPNVLAKDEVMPRLGTCIQGMVADGVLTAEEAGTLLSAKRVRTVKKGTIAKLSKACDGDPEKMGQVFSALGSTASAYIR
jgi:hypothetical protein